MLGLELGDSEQKSLRPVILLASLEQQRMF